MTYIIVAAINCASLWLVCIPAFALVQSASSKVSTIISLDIIPNRVYRGESNIDVETETRNVSTFSQHQISQISHQNFLSSLHNVLHGVGKGLYSAMTKLVSSFGHVSGQIFHTLGSKIGSGIHSFGSAIAGAVHQGFRFVSQLGPLSIAAVRGAVNGIGAQFIPVGSIANDLRDILGDVVTYAGPPLLSDLPGLIPPVFHYALQGEDDAVSLSKSLGVSASLTALEAAVGGIIGIGQPIVTGGFAGAVATAKMADAQHKIISLTALLAGAARGALGSAITELLPQSWAVDDIYDIFHNVAGFTIPAIMFDIPRMAPPVFHSVTQGIQQGIAVTEKFGFPPFTALGAAVGAVTNVGASLVSSGIAGAINAVESQINSDEGGTSNSDEGISPSRNPAVSPLEFQSIPSSAHHNFSTHSSLSPKVQLLP